MRRRISLFALFVAWLCASGAMLDGVQVFAWARMFSENARSMRVADAAIEALEGDKPCAICQVVRRARDEAQREGPLNAATDAPKLLLVFHEAPAVVFVRAVASWPEVLTRKPRSWRSAVPVPPPRADRAPVVA